MDKELFKKAILELLGELVQPVSETVEEEAIFNYESELQTVLFIKSSENGILYSLNENNQAVYYKGNAIKGKIQGIDIVRQKNKGRYEGQNEMKLSLLLEGTDKKNYDLRTSCNTHTAKNLLQDLRLLAIEELKNEYIIIHFKPYKENPLVVFADVPKVAAKKKAKKEQDTKNLIYEFPDYCFNAVNELRYYLGQPGLSGEVRVKLREETQAYVRKNNLQKVDFSIEDRRNSIIKSTNQLMELLGMDKTQCQNLILERYNESNRRLLTLSDLQDFEAHLDKLAENHNAAQNFATANR
jgi:hypothetical protein